MATSAPSKVFGDFIEIPMVGDFAVEPEILGTALCAVPFFIVLLCLDLDVPQAMFS